MRASLLIALVASLGLVHATAGPAAGQQPGLPEIVESQRRLDQIRREQAQLREEMTRIRSRVSDLTSELRNVERQASTSTELLAELDNQVTQREEQIAANTAELEQTRAMLAEREDVLHRRLREIYKRGPLQTLEVLLAAESFSDLLNRYRYLLLIARHDRQLADEVAYLEGQLVARERSLRTNVFQLESTRRDRAEEIRQLEQLRDQQGLALSSVQTRERTTAERLEALARDEARITSLLTNLDARQATSPASAAGSAPAPFDPGSRGTLPWPVDGTVLYGFAAAAAGGGSPARSGVGIAAATGSEVRAVAPGSVVLAGPFEGYGPTVIVSHGNGYYSLYLYLGRVAVREGEGVRGGQPVGAVGGPRGGEGPHLEFQFRIPGGRAVDPLTWLRPG